MTRNVKIEKVQMCLEAGCHFTAKNRTDLQKHYQLVHDLKTTVRASLIEKGWEYRFDK